MTNLKKVKKNSYKLTKKRGRKLRKKGGVKSTKKVSPGDRIELKTINTKTSPNPVVKMYDSLKVDHHYKPSSKCIKLQKELDDYDKNIKNNFLLQAEYNEQLAIPIEGAPSEDYS